MQDRLGDKARLSHIAEAIEAIENYTAGVSKEDFLSNSMMFNATLRQLEVIGEAANRISDSFQMANPQIPWVRLTGLRNVVIHEYFGIDDLMIWNIVTVNIPELKGEINKLLLAF